MQKLKIISLGLLCLISTVSLAQDTDAETGTVIQNLTPSKLIAKGQYDLKWFNNLYTQTESTFSEGREPRQTFFTSTLEAYTGVSDHRRVNLGLILEFRSNVVAGRPALDVFQFDGERGTARSGLTSIAPSIKFVPIANLSNFSIQSSVFIPLVDQETEDFTDFNPNGVFLDQDSFIVQNRFFYDYTFPAKKWQVFSELNTELSLGDGEDSFANNSLRLTPGVFLSYFPSPKFTVLGLMQHSQLLDLGNNFSQDFTALGGGAKYQLSKALNVEVLYTNFVRGTDTGLGETFNIGLRAVF
ncbi:hypothetical protein [Croceiramulus getboli]|nr:hypothetical protein P8624_02395 [Flavobacteriaceae bacterium YJPT1-3]